MYFLLLRIDILFDTLYSLYGVFLILLATNKINKRKKSTATHLESREELGFMESYKRSVRLISLIYNTVITLT